MDRDKLLEKVVISAVLLLRSKPKKKPVLRQAFSLVRSVDKRWNRLWPDIILFYGRLDALVEESDGTNYIREAIHKGINA